MIPAPFLKYFLSVFKSFANVWVGSELRGFRIPDGLSLLFFVDVSNKFCVHINKKFSSVLKVHLNQRIVQDKDDTMGCFTPLFNKDAAWSIRRSLWLIYKCRGLDVLLFIEVLAEMC